MWLSSKEAAEILGVNLRKLQRVISKAQKENQKILTIYTKIISYKMTNGVGRGGKTLWIWIDDVQLDGRDGFSSYHASNNSIGENDGKLDNMHDSDYGVVDTRSYELVNRGEPTPSHCGRGSVSGNENLGDAVHDSVISNSTQPNLEPLDTNKKALNLADKCSVWWKS